MKRKKIVYLLQNGIGYGHFHLALTVAKHFDSSLYEIIFVTQAKSVQVFENHSYRVYNFPMFYTLKANNEMALFYSLLDSLLEHLAPVAVIEDTYPDGFYQNLPSLQYVPRILIVNRLAVAEFEEYYFGGTVCYYDKLIVLKDRESYSSSFASWEVRNFVKFSDNVACFGDVFSEPDDATRMLIRRKYSMGEFEKTLVVSCGAGGWHIGENVCRTIISRVAAVAEELILKGRNLQLVILTGPYSAYLHDELTASLRFPENIRIVTFEMYADALFAEADVTILRPGYNSTLEALTGKSSVILLPGISYMEEHDVWCAELKSKYGIDYIPVGSLELLGDAVARALDHPQPTRGKIGNSAISVMTEIVRNVEDLSCADGEPAVLALSLPAGIPEFVREKAVAIARKHHLAQVCFCGKGNFVRDESMSVPMLSGASSKEVIDRYGIVAVYHDERFVNDRSDYYEKRYRLDERGVLTLEMSEIVVREADVAFRRLLYALKRPDIGSGCVVLALPADGNEDRLLYFLDKLEGVLDRRDVIPMEISEWAAGRSDCKAQSYRWQYSRPEIAKLR